MNNIILCSTGAFIGSRNNFDHTLIGKLKPALNCDGFEIFMFDYFADRPDEYKPVSEIVAEAKNSGAVFYSMHMNKRIGDLISRNQNGDADNAVKLFESNCGYAVKYGVKLLVLHLWGGLPSDKNIDVNIKMFPVLKAISDRYGLVLTVENIVCNTYKPLIHMKRLCELYPCDIKFTIDTRQAEFHKSLAETCESSFLWDNNLVSHLHINDYSGGNTDWSRLGVGIPLNSGDVDFKYFFSFFKSINFSGSITLEGSVSYYDDNPPLRLNNSLEFIKNGLDIPGI